MITSVSATDNNMTKKDNKIAEKHDKIKNTAEKAKTPLNEKNIKKTAIKNTKKENDNSNNNNNPTTNDKKEDPEIRLSNSEIHPGTSHTFLALLPNDAGGTAHFIIDNDTISDEIPVEEGQVSYTYTIPSTYSSEYYLLSLVYSGDEKYYNKTTYANLTLTPEGGKTKATIDLQNYTTKYLSTIPLKINLNKNATGNASIKINNKIIAENINLTEGTINYSYKSVENPGTYTIEVTYNGNYMYEQTSKNSTLTINKLSSSISTKDITSKAGKKTLFKATCTDELGRALTKNAVTFKINNKKIGSNKTNSKGVVTLYAVINSKLNNKINNLTVTTTATSTTLSNTKRVKLTLKQLKTKSVVPTISTIPSKTITFTATVVDEFNNRVNVGYVTFKKSGKILKKVKVSNGFAKYELYTNYQTSKKSYIYATYTGNWKYANSKAKGLYKINKLKTFTTLTAIETKIASRIKFQVHLTDQTQQKVTSGKVKLYIKSKLIGTVKVKKGLATLNYKLSKKYTAGNYRIKAVYSGTKMYLKSSKTNTMTVNRLKTTISGEEVVAIVGKKSSIKLYLTDEDQYNVEKGIVKYYVNDTYIGKSKVSKGVSKLVYRIPKRFDGFTVNYYATYEKNGLYDSSSYTNTMTVAHQKVVYVSNKGNDNNLGDKKHPYKTIKHAINHITLFGKINVLSGKYSVSGIKVDKSISIIGKGKSKTILDGKQNGKPMFNTTKRNAVLTIKSLTIQNAKSNKKFSAGAIVSTSKLNLYNVRFKNNIATSLYSGGAIYTNGILNATKTEFINNKVTNVNSQGGAIRSYNNTTYLIKCKFNGNTITGNNNTGGSAIYSESSDLIINQTTFVNNHAKGKYITGGVIRSISGAVVIDRSKFNKNTITATGYGMGGIVGSLSSAVSIRNSNINNNIVKGSSSAGGSVVYIETAAMDIYKTKMTSNKVVSPASYGGAIYGYKSVITLTKGSLTKNMIVSSQNGYGGAIYIFGGKLTSKKNIFKNNEINAKNMALAGAIYSYGKVKISSDNFIQNKINATSLGGGAIANMGNLTITKTNFIDNNASNTGNAITSTKTAKNNINNNYWGSTKPSWKQLLYGLSKPKKYLKKKAWNDKKGNLTSPFF